jgi:D-3-phosphoglycerate dehydrogenase / 2-oxoglutarate reductase
MKIAVIHDYADALRKTQAYPKLQGHEVKIYNDAYTDPARMVEQVKGCDALLLTQQRVTVTRQMLAQLPQLKFISQTGRNVGHLDVKACTDLGILVSAGGHDGASPYTTTGELAWALILASVRHLPYEVERFKQGHWHSTIGRRLYDSTLGIYAYGHIGSGVARVGKAFGMNVVCWGRDGSLAKAKADGYAVAASREAFFEQCDIISLHIKSNNETKGIITAADLARMKPTSLLVNTSRAPIIAEGALLEALKKGRPGFAAVDVYEEEPVVNANHPLLKLKNALCAPHLGYSEHGSYEHIYESGVEQLLAYAAGKPINVMNPEVAAKK